MFQDNFFSKTPWLVRKYIAKSIRKRVLKSLRLQGLGLHSAEEIYLMGDVNLQE